MSDRKPFWSSVPGVATGVAGIVSAIVGLLGVSVQLGWIGGDDNGDTTITSTVPDDSTGTASTVRGATNVAPTTARVGQFVVDPTSITIEALQPRQVSVTVSNTGDVPLTISSTITGSGAEHFKAEDVSCKSTLPPEDTCEIEVTFAPKRAGQFTAVLVVKASNGARQVEMSLKANAPLG